MATKHTMRKHKGKFQSDITRLHEVILDIIEKIDLMVFASLLTFLAVVS